MITSAQTLIAIILLPLIKRVRRRVLWFVSMFGTIICLSAELVFEVVKVNQKVIVPIKISLTGLYLVFYFIGLGPLFMVIQAEIFPKAVKTQFMNITMSISWVVYIITTQIYPLIPFWSSYAIYIGIEVVCAAVLFKYLPETHNKTLEEITAMVTKKEPNEIQI
ncbi:Hexose_transporter [Hexamita inflata]|uniref:Hexose transporter n=1 Tax=Hexamita inflata TaxID=28002 RepID=A0AA86UFA9_9EUKA|nr:Hexose transporter [Hexamita inflata]